MEEKVRFWIVFIVMLAMPARASEIRSMHWLPGWSSGLGLAGSRLDANEDAAALFHALFPEFAHAELGVPRIVNDGPTTHHHYPILIEGIALAKAVFAVHDDGEAVVLLNGALPATLPAVFPEFDASMPPPHLKDAQRVWFLQNEEAIAAWQGWTLLANAPARVILSADEGAQLDVDVAAFDAYAPVFVKSALEPDTVIQSLDALQGDDTLDGTHFHVYGPTRESARARMYEGVYTYDPNDDPHFFDQVQAYFNLTRALNWFVSVLGWDPRDTSLDVFTHIEPTNNARYVPPFEGERGWIGLGAGDGRTYRYFARDSDVAIHEFAHHVIYRTVKSARGESGVLHEGTADYFAYAVNEDPFLGEATIIPAGALRTALMPEDQRYDDVDQPLTSHYRGQYWAAFLWDLRTQIGPDADRLVMRALSYLHSESGIADMIAGLLTADRELFADDTHECLIYKRAVTRGFVRQMAQFDGTSCGLDLAQLAAQRTTELDATRPRATAQWCGVVASRKASGTALWFVIPVILAAIARRPRHEF